MLRRIGDMRCPKETTPTPSASDEAIIRERDSLAAKLAEAAKQRDEAMRELDLTRKELQEFTIEGLPPVYLLARSALKRRDDLAAIVAQMPKWTAATDGMPPIDQMVIIAFAPQAGIDLSPSMAQWNGETWDNLNWNRPANKDDVTYWMPMPAPPAGQPASIGAADGGQS
jgi:hypothetical protein